MDVNPKPEDNAVLAGISRHPLLIAIVTSGLALSGVYMTVLYKSSPNASELSAAQDRVEALERTVETLKHENDELKRTISEFVTQASTVTESVVIPEGSFIGVMDKSYIVTLDRISGGIAELSVRDLTGYSEKK
ncbi:bZIP transcription factor, partial [Mesorhizobium sp. P5_C1]